MVYKTEANHLENMDGYSFYDLLLKGYLYISWISVKVSLFQTCQLTIK